MDTRNLPAVMTGEGATKQVAGFGTAEIIVAGETSSHAMAARAQAEVQARYVMAMQRPRDTELWRQRLIKEASRPGLAEVAEYARPVGKERGDDGVWRDKIATGPTIHLLRVALQLYGNNESAPTITYDTDAMRTVRVTLSDFETNFHVSRDVTFQKQVEKRGQKKRGSSAEEGPPPDREVLGTRTNTYGDTLYICRMTLDEVRKEESRLVALAKRALAEEFLPRDVVREALAKAVAVRDAQITQDPDAARRRVLDAFADLSVSPADLAVYLGHPADRLTPTEIKELKGVYASLRDGDATWSQILEDKAPSGSVDAAQEVARQKLAAIREQAGQAKAAAAAVNTHDEAPPQTDGFAPERSAAEKAAGTAKKITLDELNELMGVCAKNGLSDEQIADLLKKAGPGITRPDDIPAAVYPMLLPIAKSMKGVAK